jgi:hypothetical protein
MNRSLLIVMIYSISLFAQQPPAGAARGGRGPRGPMVAPLEESGFQSIFDGTMKNWDCDPDFWRAENGVMTGETKADHQPKQNIFCIWRGGTPADFELKLEYRLTGADSGNSGVQYRSVELPDVAKWVMKGYQADIDARQTFTGQIYEERARGFLALRGQIAYVSDGKKSGSIGTTGDAADLKNAIKIEDWNEIHIIARGNVLIQLINGRVMCVLVDDDKAGRKMDGLIGIQLHKTTGPMKIESRNIRLKTF